MGFDQGNYKAKRLFLILVDETGYAFKGMGIGRVADTTCIKTMYLLERKNAFGADVGFPSKGQPGNQAYPDAGAYRSYLAGKPSGSRYIHS